MIISISIMKEQQQPAPGLSCSVRPRKELAAWIERYWCWKAAPEQPLPVLLPGTGHDLFFHSGVPFSPANGRAHLICVRSHPRPLDAAGPVAFTAIRFRLGALRHFCPWAPAELFDQSLTPEDLWGAEGRRWAERIYFAPDTAARIAIMEQQLVEWLERYHRRDRWMDDTAQQIYYGHASADSIHRFARDASISPRQFERIFKQTQGMTPKAFHRLARFQHTVRDLLLSDEPDLLDTALAHGYFDQSHFIHEFESYTGSPPSAFLKQHAGMSHFYNPSGTPSAIPSASFNTGASRTQ